MPSGVYQRTPAYKAGSVERASRHGHAGSELGPARRSPTYISWQNMLARCRHPSMKSYPRYGGRGITVCDRWLKFENFLADMGERPPGTQIGRLDHDGNYEPANVVWVLASENTAESNRRRRLRS